MVGCDSAQHHCSDLVRPYLVDKRSCLTWFLWQLGHLITDNSPKTKTRHTKSTKGITGNESVYHRLE
jgi:hypothetical protein